MNRTPTPDPGFDPRLADWLETAPTEAPARLLETVVAAIPFVPQRRSWLWRTPSMNRLLLAGVVAVTLAAVGVGAALLVPRDSPSVGGSSPSPTAAAQLIPDGRYIGTPLEVAAIESQVEASGFPREAKDAILDDVLMIRDATTYQTVIQVDGELMTVDYLVDGSSHPETWRITPLGGMRMLARLSTGQEIEFEVRSSLPGAGFTLQAMSPAPSEVEALVRRIVFEQSGPFVPVP
jgi:hypothetical protein